MCANGFFNIIISTIHDIKKKLCAHCSYPTIRQIVSGEANQNGREQLS